MINLIGKELKYQFKSITFYVFFIIVLADFATQFIPDSNFTKPLPEQEYYGRTTETDIYLEMSRLYKNLSWDLEKGEIIKYPPPLGIIKKVKLSNNQKQNLKQMLDNMVPSGILNNPKEDIKISYDEFINMIRNFNKYMGGYTVYSDSLRHTSRPMTYEEALKEYEEITQKDEVTNAFARIFADYMGVAAGLFIIFISAFVLLRDREKNAHEVIYSSEVSSIKYVLSKYVAICISIMICFLSVATYSTIKFINLANINKYTIDYLAFYKYTFTWIMPTVLFTVALGMFLSILFNTSIIPIVVQFMLWFNSIMPLEGEYSLDRYFIRFNTVGSYNEYMQWRNQIICNRVFYTVISFGVIILTSYVWSKRRSNFSINRKFSLKKIIKK